MTRLTVDVVFECDGCGYEESTDKEYGSPDGWVEVWESEFEEDSGYHGLEFCSYLCLSKWARGHASEG